MTWQEAVDQLAKRMAEWAPKDLHREWHPWESMREVQTLELSSNGKRLYLEPAEWAKNTLPTSVELWSNRGPRVRLTGPDGHGKWKVYSSDLVDMHVAWDQKSISNLCSDLLAV